MSSIEVYRIEEDGAVSFFDKTHNPHACSPHIWQCLSQKYGVKDPFDSLRMNGDEPLWSLYDSGQLSDVDNTVLGFTFDASWCPRERIPDLISALREWWGSNQVAHFPARYGMEAKAVHVVDTIPRLIAILERAASFRGVCFNQTSVNSNPWVVRLDTPQEDEETHPFVFGQDTRDRNGAIPVELFARRERPELAKAR